MAICITVMQKRPQLGRWMLCERCRTQRDRNLPQSHWRAAHTKRVGSKEGKTVFPKASGLCSAELLGIPEISSPKFQPVLCKEAVASKTCQGEGVKTRSFVETLT